MVGFFDRGPAVREMHSRGSAAAGGYDSGEKMAPLRVGLTPLRRVLGAAVVALLLIGAVLYYRASTSASVVAPTPGPPSSASSPPVADATPSTTPPRASVKPTSAKGPAIRVHGDLRIRAAPSQTVPIRGTYQGGPDTFVQAERREGAGKWVVFPVPARTDQLGRFIVHIEIAEVGHHWVQVVDPKKKVRSQPIVVIIEG